MKALSIINTFLLSFFLTLNASCQTGKLAVLANTPGSLKEISAVELTSNSPLLWVIEDAGNKNVLYGLKDNGKLAVAIEIKGATNQDWEELTSDQAGNIYIGDIGNNNHKRKNFSIYKVNNPTNTSVKLPAEEISFELPKDLKSYDFEAFFLYQDQFYLFSKENGSAMVFAVPNKIGAHTARFVQTFKLEGKNTKITSADISDDGKTIVLLNHDNLWKLEGFKGERFFDGSISELSFDHSSQKEGICFKNENSVYITDEKNKSSGGNLYRFGLNQSNN